MYITRPFYCGCHDIHCEATHYIVWGGTRQKLLYYPIEEPIIQDITPHIISFLDKEKDFVDIAMTCGIVGCGVRLKNPDDLSFGVVIQDVRTTSLPRGDFDALLNFKYTGYEIKTKYK